MKKKSNILAVILAFACLLFAVFLVVLSFLIDRETRNVQKQVIEICKTAQEELQKLQDASILYEEAITARTEAASQAEDAAEPEETENTEIYGPSIFSQQSAASNGYVVGIDPGHQSASIDMSATEPNGPGSTVMKAKASTGTTGSYSGLPEYQLNLDVSLKLKSVLEEKGYQVVMTRTDNETAISNAERAQLVAEQGADIYVRIHANGDDTHTVSGALTMSPSQNNPYVAHLYEDSNRLSQCILDAYCAATGFASLGVQYYDDMTGINWSSVPVTIVEMGFMTYESDDLQMADPTFQDTMAAGIADGIDDYFGL